MWRMSKRSGVDVETEQAGVCGQYLKRIRFLLEIAKIRILEINSYFFFVLC